MDADFANTKGPVYQTNYIRDLSIHGFGYPRSPGAKPLWIPRHNHIYSTCQDILKVL